MPESKPFISICIPSYKRTQYLQRLLQSIAEQTFTNYEVIVSDDSNDDSVKRLMAQFEDKFSLQYHQNQTSLGTPANWNAAIEKAASEWIKLMHDDDWFATPSALQQFADATKQNNKLIVANYNNIDENNIILYKPSLSYLRKKRLLREPMILLAENIIGQPSVCMVHRSVTAKYNERMKWRVDIDYYMQLLHEENDFTHIQNVLINLGIGTTQVTHSCLNVPGVELPEGWLLLKKWGTKPLKNLMVYDAWWRIIRNTKTRSLDALNLYASPWPAMIENMVRRQSKLNPSQLQKGILSKMYMLMSYLKDRASLR